MKKSLLAILVLVVSFSACKSPGKSVWTAEYEKGVYNQLDNVMKPRFKDDNKRKDLVSFTVKRLKAELPDGLASVPADSLNKISSKIGQEYAVAHVKDGGGNLKPTSVPWSPSVEQGLRDAILKVWQKNDLANGNKFCDCVIAKLKTAHPQGIVIPIPHDEMLQVATECQKQVLGKHRNDTIFERIDSIPALRPTQLQKR
jgi:hypothetical protein